MDPSTKNLAGRGARVSSSPLRKERTINPQRLVGFDYKIQPFDVCVFCPRTYSSGSLLTVLTSGKSILWCGTSSCSKKYCSRLALGWWQLTSSNPQHARHQIMFRCITDLYVVYHHTTPSIPIFANFSSMFHSSY